MKILSPFPDPDVSACELSLLRAGYNLPGPIRSVQVIKLFTDNLHPAPLILNPF